MRGVASDEDDRCELGGRRPGRAKPPLHRRHGVGQGGPNEVLELGARHAQRIGQTWQGHGDHDVDIRGQRLLGVDALPTQPVEPGLHRGGVGVVVVALRGAPVATMAPPVGGVHARSR